MTSCFQSEPLNEMLCLMVHVISNKLQQSSPEVTKTFYRFKGDIWVKGNSQQNVRPALRHRVIV